MLTDAALRNLKPKSKIYKASHRDRMYVTVSPSNTVTFRFDYRLNGRREALTLGRYGPGGISLAMARELLLDARKIVLKGISPALEKQREKRRVVAIKTFGTAMDTWLAGSGQFRPNDRSKIMVQHSLSFETSLLVRDARGRYRMATTDQILDAARRVVEQKVQRELAFTSPAVVKDYLRAKLAGYEYEVFAMLLLDQRHRLIDYVELFRGTLDGAAVYPREVVKVTLAHNAAAVIVSHNHPSGVPEPSAADRALTSQLRDALALIELRVLDHIVVGGIDTVSFAERWLLQAKGA